MAEVAGGPWVQIAAFCEHVLEERDGVFTAVRIVDRITFPAAQLASTPPGAAPGYLLQGLVILKSGDLREPAKLAARFNKPDGTIDEFPQGQVAFRGDESGGVIRLTAQLDARLTGLYWLDILVNDVIVTRMPLRVVHEQPGEPGDVTPPGGQTASEATT